MKPNPYLLVGYACVWRCRSRLLSKFERPTVEYIAKGAFAESIRDDHIVAMVGHDQSCKFANTTDGTLRLREDDRGLAVMVAPSRSPRGQRIISDVRRGELRGLSVYFQSYVAGGVTVRTEGSLTIRTVRKAKLLEVSLVPCWLRPAYNETYVYVSACQHGWWNRSEVA